jgi:NAD(P)H-flavin reductase
MKSLSTLSTLIFGEEKIETPSGVSALEALFRAGISWPSSCLKGTCHQCLAQVDLRQTPLEKIPQSAQRGLRPSVQKQGYFLMCQAQDFESLTLKMPREVQAHLILAKEVRGDVHLFKLAKNGLEYISGQFVNVHEQNLNRAYSLASTPHQDFLELHIRMYPNGAMTSILSQKEVGDFLNGLIEDVFLVATGTGLAPLWGILQSLLWDANQKNPFKRIVIIHGGREMSDLYLNEEMIEFTKQHNNVIYYPTLSQNTNQIQIPNLSIGRVNAITLEQIQKPKQSLFYLCGHPEMVKTLKKQIFLAGVPSSAIFTDAFIKS